MENPNDAERYGYEGEMMPLKCNELKAYKMVDEKYCTDCVCVIPSDVYIKSEADKAIAHQKHKRCLAMAKYCDASMAYFGEFHDSTSEQMVAHYYKWRGRWYELAEEYNG